MWGQRLVGRWVCLGRGFSMWASEHMMSGRLKGVRVWGHAFPAATGGRTRGWNRGASGPLLSRGLR